VRLEGVGFEPADQDAPQSRRDPLPRPTDALVPSLRPLLPPLEPQLGVGLLFDALLEYLIDVVLQ
jgi:hypothetical protein